MALSEIALLGVTGLVFFLIIVLSALPLYLAIKLLGGKASILKVVFVNIFAGIIIPIIKFLVGLYGGIVAFIFLLFVYKKMFEVGWMKAFFAWILQFVIIVILVLIVALFGFSIIAM